VVLENLGHHLIGAKTRTLECLLNMVYDSTPLSNDASDARPRESKFEEMRFACRNYLWTKNRVYIRESSNDI